MADGVISRPTTPDVSEMTQEESLALLEQTRLGRIFSSLIVRNEGGGNDTVSLATLASRIELITRETEDREARLRAREDDVGSVQQLERVVQRQNERLEEEMNERIRRELEALTAPDTSEQRMLVQPPPAHEFSLVPTLTSATRLEQRKTFFTCLSARAKFTGAPNGPSKGELDVVGLLESMTRGQHHMKLSMDEFVNVFISACASTPQTMLVEFSKDLLTGEVTIAQVYLQFSDCYFFDLRPEQAMTKLKGLKVKNTFSSLADADVSIRKLAQLASLGEETSERRTLFFQKYYRETLLSVIPDKYISVILQQIDRKKTLSGRELSPSDLLGICRAFRVEIDTFFFKKAQNATQKQEGATNQAAGKKGKRGGKGKGGNVNAATRSQKEPLAAALGDNKAPPKPNGNGGAIPKTTNGNGANGNGNGHSNGNGGKKNGNGNGNGNGKKDSKPNGNGNHSSGGNNGKNGYKGNGNYNKLSMNECKLCLQANHSFDCCPLFKQHERVVSDHTCPCALRAFHLERYCPISKPKN